MREGTIGEMCALKGDMAKVISVLAQWSALKAIYPGLGPHLATLINSVFQIGKDAAKLD